jgi:enterobacteria phage integrase
MAQLDHRTLAEAERYTRDANRRRGARAAVSKLEEARKRNMDAQTAAQRVGNVARKEGKSG